jgi:hypothetical protein
MRPTREIKHSELQNNKRGKNNKLHSVVPPKQEEEKNIHKEEGTIMCGGRAVGQWQQDLEQFKVLWSIGLHITIDVLPHVHFFISSIE